MTHERSQPVARGEDHGPRVARNTRAAGPSTAPLAGLQRKIGNQAVSRLVQRSLGDDLLQAGSQLVAGGGALSGGGAAAGAGLIGQAGSALLSAGRGAKVGEAAGGSSSSGGGLPLGRHNRPSKRYDVPVFHKAGEPDKFNPTWEERTPEWGDQMTSLAKDSPEVSQALLGGGGIAESAKDQLRWGSLPGSDAANTPTEEEEQAKSDRQARLKVQAGWDSLPFSGQ